MKIKITTQGGDLPSYETEGSAGMDIRAYVKEPVKLNPGERKLIPTGIAIELPKGYEAQIRARSGLSVKFGIGLVNAVGTIDSDYRGEIRVGLINLGEQPYTINNGDRIAQMIIAKYETAEWELSDELNRSSRGNGGFGHTGI